jgi:hypothetical protein
MMQTDVKSTYATNTGAMVPYRTRIKGIIYPNAASAGVIELIDGVGGAVLIRLVTGTLGQSINIPGEGILALNGIYLGTLTTVSAVTIIYG